MSDIKMTDIDLGNSKLSLRRQNNTEGEGDAKKVVSVNYYTLNVKGEKGITALARVTPDELRTAFGDIVESMITERLESFRTEIDGAIDDATASINDGRTTFNERLANARKDLGLPKQRKQKQQEEAPPAQ